MDLQIDGDLEIESERLIGFEEIVRTVQQSLQAGVPVVRFPGPVDDEPVDAARPGEASGERDLCNEIHGCR